jgi:hypothetical protein
MVVLGGGLTCVESRKVRAKEWDIRGDGGELMRDFDLLQFGVLGRWTMKVGGEDLLSA